MKAVSLEYYRDGMEDRTMSQNRIPARDCTASDHSHACHSAFTVYAAGKAATSGVPSIYAPSIYTHLSPAKTPPPPPAMIPMGPPYGYPGDYDRNSSGEAWGKPN